MMPTLKAFGAAVALSTAANACSDVSLTYKREGTGHVSARTMDWGSDFHSTFSAFPRGTPLKRYPTYTSYTSARAGHDKAIIGFVAVELQALSGAIADGLNEHGFGVGVLWMEHPALMSGSPGMGVGEFGDFYPSFNASDPRLPMTMMDLPGQLLSSCKTVKDAVELVRQYQILATEKHEFPPELFCSSTPECNPAIHLALHDAHGKSAVIEFIGEANKAASPECFADSRIGGTAAPNGGRVCIYDNSAAGVMTNEPTLETHRRLVHALMRRKGDSNPALFDVLQHEFGGYSSTSRFGRLSVLNTLGARASPTCASPGACGWSDTRFLSNPDKLQHPHGFSFESNSAAVDRIAQAARQIQTAVRPYGINVVDPTYGATQWTVIRDHTNKRFLFNSPASISFHSVDIVSLGLSQQGPKRTIPIANQKFDFPDVSADLTPISTKTKGTLRGSVSNKRN